MSNQRQPISYQFDKSAELLELYSILENIDRGFMSVNRNWCITYLNKKAADNIGRKSGELIRKNLWSEFPQLEGTNEAKIYRKAMDERVAVEIEEFGVITGRWNQKKAYPTANGIAIAWADITERKKAEETLQISEEKFSKAFNSSPAAISISRLSDGLLLDVNGAYFDIFGYSPQEAIGHTSTELGIFTSADARSRLVGLLKEKGKIYNLEMKFKSKTGKISDTLLSMDLIKIAHEDCVITTVLDITDRKRAEEGLKESEARFSKAFNNNPAAMAISNIDGQIVDVNESFERLLGYAKGEVIGKVGCDIGLYSPSELKELFKRLKEKGKVCNFEMILRHRLGHQVNVLFSLELITLNKESYSLGIAIDNTERKKAEEALKESEQLYRTLFDNSDDGFMLLEPIFNKNGVACDFRFLKLNSAYTRQTGARAEDVLGKLASQVTPDLEPEITLLSGNVSKTGKSIHNEAYSKYSNKWFDSYYFPYSESKIGILFRDITERKKAEEALRVNERMATIGQTAGMVGHDLRNPLQSIAGEVYLAKSELDSLPDGEGKSCLQESIQTISEQVAYMDKIVSDLQTFVKPVEANIESTDLKMLITTILEQTDLPKNIQTRKQIGDRLVVKADEQLLKRVLINLVTNAVQAMPGGGELTLKAQARGKRVQIMVEDTGTGIPNEVKSKIFTPLFTTKSKGQGFGLAVCKRVIEAQHGTITFESEVGNGTKFIIELPTNK